MRFAAVAVAFAGVAAANAGAWGPPSNGTWGGASYVTETVTAFTTYCPEATKITHNGETYTVTSATTLTITNCPCTVTKPVSSSVGTTSIYKPSGTAPHGTASSGHSTAKTSATSSPITPSKGGASQLEAGAAAVLAVFGLVAAL